MPGIHVLSEVGVRRLEVPRAQVENPRTAESENKATAGIRPRSSNIANNRRSMSSTASHHYDDCAHEPQCEDVDKHPAVAIEPRPHGLQ